MSFREPQDCNKASSDATDMHTLRCSERPAAAQHGQLQPCRACILLTVAPSVKVEACWGTKIQRVLNAAGSQAQPNPAQ